MTSRSLEELRQEYDEATHQAAMAQAQYEAQYQLEQQQAADEAYSYE